MLSLSVANLLELFLHLQREAGTVLPIHFITGKLSFNIKMGPFLRIILAYSHVPQRVLISFVNFSEFTQDLIHSW
jgi:hypothetical protein